MQTWGQHETLHRQELWPRIDFSHQQYNETTLNEILFDDLLYRSLTTISEDELNNITAQVHFV